MSIQLINDSSIFSNNFNLNHFTGIDYHSVAVFGSQSTGKSTLLNSLFNTQFNVMQDNQRQQTTKGIWVAFFNNILVLDVEGTDGRERGENQDFERKSALFCISIAEVVIVNMWEHQIGLYQGANLGLLKTVFEVNLQLFDKRGSPKTRLLFVIRDYLGNTPFDNLKQTLSDDLKNIWSSINKPKGLELSRITDFFDLDFIALPSKYTHPDEFVEKCSSLQKRFIDPSNSDYIFLPDYAKQVPADGFPKYAQDLWNVIVNNKDLDLPTQQQLLAQFRCDEIINSIYIPFSKQISDYRLDLERGLVIDNLGDKMSFLLKTSLQDFDKDAHRYHPDVYNRKRIEFNDKMTSDLKLLYIIQLRNLRRKSISLFKSNLAEKIREKGDFGTKLKQVENISLSYFEDNAISSRLCEDWNFEEEMEELSIDLMELGSKLRQDEIEKHSSHLLKQLKIKINDELFKLFNSNDLEIWKKIWKKFVMELSIAEESLIEYGKLLELNTEETLKAEAKMKREAWDSFISKIKEETSEQLLLTRLRTKFDQGFRYDDKTGVPRIWKPDDDIDTIFQTSRNETEKMFEILSSIDIPLDDINDIIPGEIIPADDLILLNDVQRELLKERFRRDVDGIYMDAKRSIINTQAHVPPWMMLLTMILGWNEFVALVSNPIYFLLFLVVGGGGYLLYVTGMSEPVKKMMFEYGKELTTGAKPMLEDVVGKAKDGVKKVVDVGNTVLESHVQSGQVDVELTEVRKRNLEKREDIGGWRS